MREELIRFALDVLYLFISTLLPILIVQGIQAIRDVRIRNYVQTLVGYAAMRIPDKHERYTYVAREIKRRYPSLNEDDVRHLIEAAVLAVKQASRDLSPND